MRGAEGRVEDGLAVRRRGKGRSLGYGRGIVAQEPLARDDSLTAKAQHEFIAYREIGVYVALELQPREGLCRVGLQSGVVGAEPLFAIGKQPQHRTVGAGRGIHVAVEVVAVELHRGHKQVVAAAVLLVGREVYGIGLVILVGHRAIAYRHDGLGTGEEGQPQTQLHVLLGLRDKRGHAVGVEKGLVLVELLFRSDGLHLEVHGNGGLQVEPGREYPRRIRLTYLPREVDIERVEAHGAVMGSDANLVRTGRRDKASHPHRQLVVHLGLEVEIEEATRLVVASVGYEVGYFPVGDSLVVSRLGILVGKTIAGLELTPDILLLLVISPLDRDAVEHQVGSLALEYHALQLPGLLRQLSGNTTLDRVHQLHGIVIPDFGNLPGFGKIEQSHITQIEPHQNTVLGIECIVALLHNHILDLVDEVVFLGFIYFRGYDAADNNIGVEVRLHHIDREIVVDTPVVNQHTVNLDGLENEGKTHRSPHGIAQIAIAQHQLALVIDIGSHSPERYEKVVEIPVALGRIGGKQAHKGVVHGERIDEAVGQEMRLELGGVLQSDVERNDFGRRVGFLEVVDIALVEDTPRPQVEVVGENQVQHIVGRVAHGIPGTHDSPHRRTGYIVDRHIVLFERLDDTDMRYTLGSATTQHQTNRLGRHMHPDIQRD